MFHRYIVLFCCAMILTMQTPNTAYSFGNAGEDGAIVMSRAQKTTNSPKWRLMYVEGGPYIDFPYIFKATVDAMKNLGIIEKTYPYDVVNENSTKNMWDWLAENAGGNYVEFVQDGFYSANWDEDVRKQNKIDILDRLNTTKDIDVVITFGTGAGRDMSTDEHKIPMLSMSVTDAVQAGIIQSKEDSGRDHVHGQIEVGRYERQLSIFHDIFQFKKLGVPVPTTDDGRASIAYNDVLKAGKTLGFEVVPCDLDFYAQDTVAFNNLQQCISTLAPQVDAMYMTTNSGMQWDKMQALLAPIISAEIPSFSQSGLMETKLGVLMSIAQSSFDSEGIHGATALKALIEGAKPRDIGQTFEGPLGLAINLEMARLIGWNPPFEILVAVDLVYQKIHALKDAE